MNAVNRWGVMAGFADCRSPAGGRIDHALFWDGYSEFPTDLGVYPGANTTEANDINDSYFFVGTANGSGGDTAFIYDYDFGFYALPKLPAPTGAATCQAQALNNLNKKNGLVQVVGFCRTTGSRTHAVRWNVTLLER